MPPRLFSLTSRKEGCSSSYIGPSTHDDPFLFISGSAQAVDAIFMGNVIQSSSDAAYLARHVGLQSGLRESVPALTLNRLCGSGMQALISGAQEILASTSASMGGPRVQCVLAGGTENMSQAPHVLRGARTGLRFSFDPAANALEDTLATSLRDAHAGCLMGETAETLAREAGLDRAACDAFAAASHQRAMAASSEGRFKDEIVPVDIPGRKGSSVRVDVDEGPRPDTTAESMAALPAVFKGVTTAGNASGISDGAASLLLATDALCAERGWAPLCELLDWQVVGVDPSRMGIGPLPAIQSLLTRHPGLSLGPGSVSLLEINEAFAAQALAVLQGLADKDPGKVKALRAMTNTNGGAIALGHPLGASGARLVAHLAHRLARDRTIPYAIASACIGGGQGIAVLLRNYRG
jgi:acetyl-CoA acyltransferase 2